jgi:hypothetical protein
MTSGAVVSASLLAALANPTVWIIALAGFLLRGGIVLVLAPVVVIPSAVGLANAFGPMLTTIVLGGPSPQIVVLLIAVIGAAFIWLLGGGWLAAAFEAETIRRIALDDAPGSDPVVRPARGPLGAAGPILAARLVAALPFVVALAAGSMRLVDLTYRELTLPSEIGAALLVRVVRGAPDALFWMGLTWLLFEIWGAMAARRIVLAGDDPLPALGRSVLQALRRPVATLALAILPLAVLLVVLVPSAVASGTTWDAIRAELAGPAAPLTVAALVLLFVLLWGAGLVLLGMVSAWRSAAWTIELAGTFGGVTDHLTGEWSSAPASARLGDLRPREVEHDPR